MDNNDVTYFNLALMLINIIDSPGLIEAMQDFWKCLKHRYLKSNPITARYWAHQEIRVFQARNRLLLALIAALNQCLSMLLARIDEMNEK